MVGGGGRYESGKGEGGEIQKWEGGRGRYESGKGEGGDTKVGRGTDVVDCFGGPRGWVESLREIVDRFGLLACYANDDRASC